MSRIEYEGSEQFRPVSAWGYVGYSILFSIPIIGLILLIVFALSSENINRRNFARSYFCALLLSIIIVIALSALVFFNAFNVRESIENNLPQIQQTIENTLNISNHSTTTMSEPTFTDSRVQNTSVDSEPSQISTSVNRVASSVSAVGIRPEVKEAIDGYEEFFNEYAEFTKKYSSSDDSLTMLADYTKMMSKYVANMEEWEAFDDENDLNEEETKYYLDATIRIEKVLLDAI